MGGSGHCVQYVGGEHWATEWPRLPQQLSVHHPRKKNSDTTNKKQDAQSQKVLNGGKVCGGRCIEDFNIKKVRKSNITGNSMY